MLKSTGIELPIHQIRQSNRVRKLENYSTKENTIAELKESIKANGLICPIAVMPMLDAPDTYTVIAGDRRRTCLQELWEEGDMRFATVQCVVYPYTEDEEALLRIALFENIHRAQLTWQEKAAGIKQLHELMVTREGKRALGGRPGVGWRQADTAEFFGISQQAVNQALTLSAAAERDPQIAACHDRKDAMNILMKKAEQSIIAEQVRRRKKAADTSTAGQLDIARKKLSEAYVVADAMEFLARLPQASIGFLNLDWPWNINAIINKTGSNAVRAANTEDEALGIMSDEDYSIFMHQVLAHCFNVMALDSWIIVWFSSNNHAATVEALKITGFAMESLPAVWTKDTSSLSKQPDRRLNSGYEQFFYAWKGCPYIAQRNRSNVFYYPQASGVHKNHPAEKPIALMQDIISTFAFLHMRVCDPFAGSGNALLAAANLNMDCCGCDMMQQHYDRYALRVFDGKPGEYK